MAEIDEAIARLNEAVRCDFDSEQSSQFKRDLALLLSHVEAMRWRPIEEAPKNGTRVLVFRPLAPPHSRMIGIDVWSGRYKAWAHTKSEEQPTHFMPLPKGPSDE